MSNTIVDENSGCFRSEAAFRRDSVPGTGKKGISILDGLKISSAEHCPFHPIKGHTHVTLVASYSANGHFTKRALYGKLRVTSVMQMYCCCHCNLEIKEKICRIAQRHLDQMGRPKFILNHH